MNYTTLPNTDIKVSKICLGTMTFGEQNSENDAHSQLDYAVEKGINFIEQSPAKTESVFNTKENPLLMDIASKERELIEN